MNYILIKNSIGYEEFPVEQYLDIEGLRIGIDDLDYCRWKTVYIGLEVCFYNDNGICYENPGCIGIANNGEDIVVKDISFEASVENGILKVFCGEQDSSQEIYVNGVRLHKSLEEDSSDIIKCQLNSGDFVMLDRLLFVYHPKHIIVYSIMDDVVVNLDRGIEKEVPFENFPEYTRSPRLIYQEPDDKVEIKKAPAVAAMPKGSLVQAIVSPLVMLCVTVLVAVVMKRGIFVIISVASTTMTIIFSVTKYINDKKDCYAKNKIRREKYDEYLLKKRKELYDLKQKAIEANQYNYPSIKDIEKMISNYSSRIYERNSVDDDFLEVVIGSCREKAAYSIDYSYDELKLEADELDEKSKQIKDSFEYIENKSITINLRNAHCGLVGNREVVKEQLKLIVAQLTFQQSYHDMQIILIHSKENNDDYRWMRWYPHLKIQHLNMSGDINSEQMRDQVLGSLFQILKDRDLKVQENSKQAMFLPHFVFIIDEPKLIMDHSIMEYLNKSGIELGFSVIYTSYLRGSLPEIIGTIVEIRDSEEAILIMNENEVVDKTIKLNHIGDCDLEWMARNLSTLNHIQGITTKIPESITFFDLYGIKKPEQFNALERWNKNHSHKSLAVPLGVRAENDVVSLNLHEKAHGPHGLVAGTTGSGKSEIIQSYILSLAVNFHPYEVGFLLIDYKGGGMAGLFKNLPHLLGTITNLDGSESKRAMASIKSELARRQSIFSENNVNHINSYNKLYKNGEVSEPIPHLFLISDEFAELKKEQPDFMTELVSTARIGRSLGIHLILATQKPTGVVNDQIWTNSKFKLALKVQDEGDSREIIKTPDAAYITQAGRAYLQVGNNEIYELFQSAWSGAEYVKDGQKKTKDNRVYLINDLGQGELLNDDLSVIDDDDSLKETQLDVTIRYLHDVFEAQGIEYVKKPWLPSLPHLLVSPISNSVFEENWGAVEEYDARRLPDLTVEYGIVDIPEEQCQTEYMIDLEQDGNIAYFASAGYGKTVFLTTTILTLAAKNQVENINFYILDFGNSALIPLSGLPHTAEYIAFDHTEKISKFIKLITEEINIRKKLFANKMVQNFSVYNQSAIEPLKSIVVVVDNFDVVKEVGMDAEEFFTRLSRDGAGLGIYLIITATRGSAVRYSIINNFKNKIAGFFFDESEARNIVGKSEYKLSEDKGRALVKMTNVNIMQLYSFVEFQEDLEYIQKIKDAVAIIQSKYPDRQAPHIPILPENFNDNMISDYPLGNKDIHLTIGLEMETVTRHGFANTQAPFVIIGESGRGKTNIVKVLLKQMTDADSIYIFDAPERNLVSYSAMDNVNYIKNSEDIEDFLEDIKKVCRTRKSKLEKALEENAMLVPSEFYKNEPSIYIILDEVDDFVNVTKAFESEMFEVMKTVVECGIGLIATVNSNKLKGMDHFSRWIKTSTHGVVLSQQGILNIFPVRAIRDYPTNVGVGLLFHNGEYCRVLVPESV